MRRSFATERTLIVNADASTRERASVVTQLERPAVRDVLDELLDFHADIHAMLAQLDRVGFDVDVDVGALRSFLTGPLTWHDEDEEVTVLARLRRRRQWNEHLDHVTAGHEKLEDLLDRIVPLLDHLPTSGPRVRDAAAQLRGLLVGHMKLEEEFLFPLARSAFDSEALADMRKCMRGTNGGGRATAAQACRLVCALTARRRGGARDRRICARGAESV